MEKKGFIEKIKEFFKKLKEDNKGFGAAMKRINSSGFCGNVNRGIKNGDFWEGSYVNIEDGKGVIFGSNQEDYFFTGADIASFEVDTLAKPTVSKGNQQMAAIRVIITFTDGKRAQADLIAEKISTFKMTLGL